MNISLIKAQIRAGTLNNNQKEEQIQEKLVELRGEDEEPKYWEPISYEISDINKVIDSLVDMNKKKKSYKNFILWLNTISDKLMEEKKHNDEKELFN